MGITLSSLIMAVLWSDIFIIIGYLLIKGKRFLAHFSIYPVLFLIVTSVFRMIFSFDFPFATIIHSHTVYPFLMGIAYATPLSTISVLQHTTISQLFLFVWLTVTIILTIRIIRKHYAGLRLLNSRSHSASEKLYSIMNTITNSRDAHNCVSLLQCNTITSPIITGLRKPIIYLPDITLDEEQWFYILKHEWYHHLHHDLWVKLLIHAFCLIFWWNPLVYLLKRNLDDALELKVDLLLTKTLPHEEKRSYLHTILNIAQTKCSNTLPATFMPTGLGLALSKKDILQRRFYFVLNYTEHRYASRIFTTVTVLFLSALFILSYSFIIQAYTEPPDTPGISYFTIAPDNAYLLDKHDGSYSLYADGIYRFNVKDISEEPFNTLEIR